MSYLKLQEQSFAAKAQVLQSKAGHNDTDGAFVVQQASSTISNINHFLKTVDPSDIEAATAKLKKARKVILVGMMSSRPFVEYLAYVSSMAFDCWNVYGGDAGSNAALLSDTCGSDVALVISKAPYASQAIRAAAHLKQNGVQIIGITDKPISPLCQHANIAFLVPTETPQFFTSHAVTLVLLETLIGLVVKASGEQVGERIAQIEAKCHEMGEYLQYQTQN